MPNARIAGVSRKVTGVGVAVDVDHRQEESRRLEEEEAAYRYQVAESVLHRDAEAEAYPAAEWRAECRATQQCHYLVQERSLVQQPVAYLPVRWSRMERYLFHRVL